MPKAKSEKFTITAKLDLAKDIIECLYMWRLNKADAIEVLQLAIAKIEKGEYIE